MLLDEVKTVLLYRRPEGHETWNDGYDLATVACKLRGETVSRLGGKHMVDGKVTDGFVWAVISMIRFVLVH